MVLPTMVVLCHLRRSISNTTTLDRCSKLDDTVSPHQERSPSAKKWQYTLQDLFETPRTTERRVVSPPSTLEEEVGFIWKIDLEGEGGDARYYCGTPHRVVTRANERTSRSIVFGGVSCDWSYHPLTPGLICIIHEILLFLLGLTTHQ